MQQKMKNRNATLQHATFRLSLCILLVWLTVFLTSLTAFLDFFLMMLTGFVLL